MGLRKRKFTKEFKVQVVQELESGKPVEQVCREHEIKHDMVYRWRKEFRENGIAAFAGKGNTYKLEAKNAQLERTIGELYMENRFLKKALEKLGELAKKGK
jgi:transposase